MKKVILFFLILFFAGASAQTIPASRITDWSSAGYVGIIPDSSVVIDATTFGAVGDSVTDNYTFIMNAINSLNGNRGVISFPSGNYLIESTINLPDSVILRGVSSDSTHLIFDFAGVAGNSISITGNYSFPFTNLLSGFEKGSTSMVVADTTGFSTGDFAEIEEDNGSWDTQPASWADQSIGQIIRIQSISGDTLFFNMPLRIKYDSTLNVQVRKFIPAKEIGIECLNLFRRDSVASGVCINIYFDHASNCWVRGVESSRSVGSHVEADASSHLEVTGSYAHHAFAYDGVSTHGYGFTLFKHSCECKFENNIMRHLRHSFSMQCGANGNVIAYNYSIDPNRSEFPSNFGADISMHGHYPFANLFEGNIVQNIQLDQTWGPSGPFNTFFRNRAELYGIVMSSGTVNSDSENFVGNEITNTGAFMGNYTLAGSGHFEFGNNVRGTINPSGTILLNDSSYYLATTPSFWNSPVAFPSVGEPNVPGSGSNPARDRYLAGINLTACSEIFVTGKYDEEEKNSITLYPNPARDLLTIAFGNLDENNVRIAITDILGNKLVEEKISEMKNKNEINFHIPESLKPGMYFLTLVTESKMITRKIILE